MAGDDAGKNGDLHRRGFRAMATQFELLSRCASASRAEAAFLQAEAEIRRVERIFSRFIKSSDIQRLNDERSGSVCPELLEVVSLALAARDSTGGRFDPTVYDALSRPAVDPPGGLPWAAGHVRTDRAKQRIELAPGTRLDLGGIVKGWTADRACVLLAVAGSCLVNAGGDIAMRTVGDDPPWPVGVGGASRVLDIANGGVATSSQSVRRWVRAGAGGTDSRHIIDPASGNPVTADTRSIVVVAASATAADIWATALVVAGAEGALRIANEQRLACVVTRLDGSSATSSALSR